MRRSSIVTGLLAAIVLLPGCMHWKNHPVSPEQVVNQHPKEVRIQRRDTTMLELRQPRMSGDSIIGTSKQGSEAGISLYDVSRIESREVDGVATAVGVVVGVAAATILYMLAIWEEP